MTIWKLGSNALSLSLNCGFICPRQTGSGKTRDSRMRIEGGIARKKPGLPIGVDSGGPSRAETLLVKKPGEGAGGNVPGRTSGTRMFIAWGFLGRRRRGTVSMEFGAIDNQFFGSAEGAAGERDATSRGLADKPQTRT